MNTPFRAAAFLLALVAALPAETRRPNVLFIAVDDLRPEIGCFGNTVIRTPNLDRLGKQGTVFLNAYCQQAVCSPSRTSLLTGRRPDETKVWDLETHFRKALPDVVTLPQHFKNQGYFVQGMGKIYHGGYDDAPSWSVPWGTPKAPLYASAESLASSRTNKDAQGVSRGPAFESADVPDDTFVDGKVARLAAQTLSELGRKADPFFLAVGFARPHLPFVAPKKYWDLYDPRDIYVPAFQKLPADAPAYAGHSNGELHSYAGVPKGNPIPEDFARKLRHGYYAATSYLDAQLGIVLDALEKAGLSENTIVVVWGDHGWQLGEHGLWHKHTNFEIAARAPLIIRAPGSGGGRRSASLAEFTDVYPTLVDLCGLPPVAGLAGTSLRPVLTDATAKVRPVAISQYPRPGNLMGYSIRDERWRLTLWRNRQDNTIRDTELYDEQNDPDETVNVAAKPENREVVERLSRHLPPPIASDPRPGAAKPTGQAGKKGPGKDRGAMFDGRDSNKDGRLNREEFMLRQPDPEQAAANFLRFDSDKSGDISRDEYIRAGK